MNALFLLMAIVSSDCTHLTRHCMLIHSFCNIGWQLACVQIHSTFFELLGHLLHCAIWRWTIRPSPWLRRVTGNLGRRSSSILSLKSGQIHVHAAYFSQFRDFLLQIMLFCLQLCNLSFVGFPTFECSAFALPQMHPCPVQLSFHVDAFWLRFLFRVDMTSALDTVLDIPICLFGYPSDCVQCNIVSFAIGQEFFHDCAFWHCVLCPSWFVDWHVRTIARSSSI